MKLSIKNGSVTLNGNTILEEVNIDIEYGVHYAIVGNNGAGKTTLLKALLDNELFDEGVGSDKFQITKIGNFNIGYMHQLDFNDEITLLDTLKTSFKDLIDMENQMDKLLKLMEKNNTDEMIKKYTDLQERYKLLGGYSYKSEYEVMLNKFGFQENDKYKKMGEFSGGQKTKISFIKLLLSKPDLLILDEPTNHLDITTIEWLESYLRSFKGALVIVSHDRMFINNIADVIYDIDYGKTTRYKGNYEFFEKEKRIAYDKLVKDYEMQQAEMKRLRAIYERFRYKPSKASMAMSKLHKLEKMEVIDKPNDIETKTFKTNLDEIEQSVKNVLMAKDLEIGYDVPLAKLDLDIKRGKKIGVIGANGTGKSTLLKTLEGLITPYSGDVSYGLHVKPGYFDQNLVMLDEENTVLKEFRDYLPSLTEMDSRRALGSFLFRGEDVLKKVNVLSGGEKVRLELCKILYNKPNFLILDEPTNHMDIASKEHLESILEAYKGTMIFVSHDRYFVKKIANQLLVFENDEVKFYPYGYEEYLREKNLKETIKEIKVEQEKKVEQIVEKVNVYNLKKELKTVESKIIKLETKLKELNASLFNEEIYADQEKLVEVNSKIKSSEIELEDMMIEWEKLTDLIMENS